MKNIVIEKTSSGTYVVKADTERFGEQEIMFESYSKAECVQYILKTVVSLFRATGKEMYLAAMIDWMGKDKMSQLTSACERNAYLTSYYGLEHIRVYESATGGVYVKMEGTRSSFSLYIDGNGEIKRAPAVKSMLEGQTYHGTNVFSFMG